MNTVTGSLRTMAVPDLLQWLLTVAKTGVLVVLRDGVSKKLFFDRGAIVGASSSDPDLAFGQFLLDLGKLTEEQLVDLVRQQRETGVMLGKLLTNQGLLSSEDVHDVLKLKARETIFELMAWREGDFEFTEQDFEGGDQIPLVLPIDSVIFEGIRKAEMRRKMRESFPSGNVVPAVLSDESRELLLGDEHAAPMVSLMDRGMSIRELARRLRLSVVDVCEILYPYLSDGHVVVGVSEDPKIPSYYLPPVVVAELVRPAKLGDDDLPLMDLAQEDLRLPDPDRLVDLARELRDQGFVEEAVATIEKALEVAPFLAKVAQAAAEIQEQYSGILWSFFDGGEKIPVLAVGLRDLPVVNPLLTADETFVATRVSGADSVADIVRLAPIPELKTLQILRGFAEAELIIFRDAGAAAP